MSATPRFDGHAWDYRDALLDYSDRLIRDAENLARMAARGQDRLALGAALDLRLAAGQAVELARELAAIGALR